MVALGILILIQITAVVLSTVDRTFVCIFDEFFFYRRYFVFTHCFFFFIKKEFNINTQQYQKLQNTIDKITKSSSYLQNKNIMSS